MLAFLCIKSCIGQWGLDLWSKMSFYVYPGVAKGGIFQEVYVECVKCIVHSLMDCLICVLFLGIGSCELGVFGNLKSMFTYISRHVYECVKCVVHLLLGLL